MSGPSRWIPTVSLRSASVPLQQAQIDFSQRIAPVQSAAIVPHDHVSRPPTMGIDDRGVNTVGDQFSEQLGSPVVGCGKRNRSRQPLSQLVGEARAGQHGNRGIGDLVQDYPMHEGSCRLLDSLGTQHDRREDATRCCQGTARRAHGLRWHDQEHRLSVDRVGDFGGCVHANVDRDAG